MNEYQLVFTIGACIFGAATIVAALTWIYFVCHAYQALQPYTSKTKKGKAYEKSQLRIHWLRAIWIYATLFACCFTFLVYYCSSALGAGIAPTPTGDSILWSRWLVAGLVGIIAHVCLAFILTHHIGDYYGNEFDKESPTTSNSQSLWIILFYFISVACIFFGTLSDNRSVQITLFVFCIVSFILSFLGYFFPFNKITFVNNNDHHDGSGLHIKDGSNRRIIVLFQRYAFLLFIVISHTMYFLIWVLSASNNITDIIDLHNEIISYVVADSILLIPMIFIMIVLSLRYKQKGVVVKDKETGKVHYGSNFNLEKLL